MSTPSFAMPYRVSEDDYIDAMVFAATRTRWRTLTFMLAALALAAIVAPDLRWALLVGGTVGVIAVFPLQAVLMPRRARRIYREQPSLGQKFGLRLSHEHFESFQDAGVFRSSWADFLQWDESGRMLLLYLNRAMFISLPKEQIGLDSSAFIRQRLEETGLPARGKRRK